MSNAYFNPPPAVNEPSLSYAPGTTERDALKAELARMKAEQVDIPMTIGGKKITTGDRVAIHPPHEIKHTLGHYHKGGSAHVQQAIDAALAAKPAWEALPWQERAAIFLKAADLISGPYRYKINAATMLGQSKTPHQSEIESVAELADFFRFNVQFMIEMYEDQPLTEPGSGIWNRVEYRPLEGFVFAITPFNFTAIAGNLPGAPALLGNTVVWKPAETQVYAAAVIMEILEEAGLPDGVINMILVDGPVAGDIIFEHQDFAGLHFTGSTKVFQHLWQTIGKNLPKYRTYPRIVGETGGKDFLIAHPSAPAAQVATALVRGAYEYQGQKCSAASRAYLPESLWPAIKTLLVEQVGSIKMGNVEDFSNFMGAVIDERAFDKISGYIAEAKKSTDAEVLIGGGYDKSEGYFIEPTVIVTTNPNYRTMEEEIFGPVLTIFVYQDDAFEATLDLIDRTSPYALTGAVFSCDRGAVDFATHKLRHSAGNFYINDKPTGAVVGQQPFGGARGSGTNDKAGSIINLYRWVSARSIKENFVSPTDYRYPYMG
ncbi:L-glutamate gamma-semialdehyde dehydrogenase [Phaeodactylibacter luteus]|uniref:L-glutamate gamma-semialdehyde dehydrogenase n=1 Tax=Phaeodactylibacter luteus TaxID=1564516 RepID=A0A5C6RJN8_9BACT|nr:L-glutamate gamma-semialdehyde dehydrogenase [Phaeodactylibacter luteus]TXB61542.1 L-glutamate gamma-semialdehyde dehydrogenase [Phaeodactylibacter luteus]